MLRETQSAVDLSQAALQYGPFLFAIVFIVFVPPYAHAIWRRSFAVANNAAGQDSLLGESRLYFRCSWMFGVLLVVCSVLWWAYTQQIEIARATQYIAYPGYVTGLAPQDQLFSLSPDDNAYLVPANIDGNIQYRFVYLSHKRVDDIIDLYVSYTNSKIATTSDGRGLPVLLIPFKLKPGETHYKFVVDKNKGAMVVPVGWSGS